MGKAEKAVKGGNKDAEKAAKTSLICSKHKKSEASSKAIEVGLKQQAAELRTKRAERKLLATSGEEAVKAMREKKQKAENHQKAEKREKRMEYDRGLKDGCPGGDCVKGWLKKNGRW